MPLTSPYGEVFGFIGLVCLRKIGYYRRDYWGFYFVVRMRNFLEKSIFGGALLTFFVPWLVPYHTYIFPFIVPKVLWFRSLAIIMIVVYGLLLALNYQRYKVRLTPITGAVLVYLASLVLSTFTSVDWYRSFWDGHERMLGVFTLLHYIGFYFALTHVGFDKAKWQWLLRWFMAAATVVMIVGVGQKINPMLLLNNGSVRVAGTLGNSIYLGGYGLFLIFLSALAGWRERERLWRFYAVITGLFGVAGLLFSGTRGTLVGLAAGLVVSAVTLFITSPRGSLVRKWVGGAAAAGVVLVVLLYAFRTTAFVTNIPAVGVLVNTSVSSATAGTRIMSWQIAIEAWQEKPVLGWGVNNFFYAFNQHYRPEFLRYGWGETWFDNAHNIIMNTLATQGIIGVTAFLGIFGAAAWMLIGAYRAKRLELPMLVFGLGFLTAHLVQATFVFENPTSSLYFFFTLAMLNQVAMPPNTAKQVADKPIGSGLLVAAGVVAVLMVYSTNVRVANGNKLALKALQSLYSNPAQALDYYNKALASGSPHTDDIRADFARVVDQLIPQYSQAKRQDIALTLFKSSYEALKQNRAMHPYDIRNQLNIAQLAIVGSRLDNKPSYLLEAQEALEDALTKSPRRQQVQFLLAAIYSQIGQRDQAIAVLEQAWQGDKTIEGAWWRLALAYHENGNTAKAKALFAEADNAGIVFGGEGQQVRALVNPAK